MPPLIWTDPVSESALSSAAVSVSALVSVFTLVCASCADFPHPITEAAVSIVPTKIKVNNFFFILLTSCPFFFNGTIITQ
jgi:hypothetical protein